MDLQKRLEVAKNLCVGAVFSNKDSRLFRSKTCDVFLLINVNALVTHWLIVYSLSLSRNNGQQLLGISSAPLVEQVRATSRHRAKSDQTFYLAGAVWRKLIPQVAAVYNRIF